jgi:uncharacterized membrane-anchored protein
MASTFVTRLRVGGKLVDANGVARLHRNQIPGSTLLLLVGATLVAVAVTLWLSPVGRVLYPGLGAGWDAFVFWLQDLVS